jgi:membrane protein YdbS with pleckstrin-like domain
MTEDKASPTPSIDYSFPGQREDEEVKFILRRHPITLVPVVFISCFMVVLPLAAYSFFIAPTFPFFLREPYHDFYFLLTTIYYGFLWIILFIEWLDYYLDVWIITNQRILDIQQKNLFHRVASEIDLKRVQDISSTVEGPLQTFFQYGDIQIQTASENNLINPRQVPHPVTVRREIMELCKAAQDESGWGIHA